MNIQIEQPLVFVLPEGKDIPSGGHRYNRFLLRALDELGVAFKRQTLDQWQASSGEVEGLYWFDSLDLPRLATSRFWPLRKGKSILIVHHLTSLFPPQGDSSTWFGEHEWPLLRQFDGYLVTSKFTANYLKRQGISPPKILTAAPGLEITLPSRRDFSLDIRAVLVGNILPRKGIMPLLEELEKGLAQDSSLQLALIGSTVADPAYEQKCNQL
ncbi:MAG: hypothetical protein AAF804_16595, partial [Bacteroidota bacterium]